MNFKAKQCVYASIYTGCVSCFLAQTEKEIMISKLTSASYCQQLSDNCFCFSQEHANCPIITLICLPLTPIQSMATNDMALQLYVLIQ
jgi:hypothetical protein